MPNAVKTPAATWIECARKARIAEGLAGVKVDRLAKTLGVTRGGFYHNFRSCDDLMARLIAGVIRLLSMTTRSSGPTFDKAAAIN